MIKRSKVLFVPFTTLVRSEIYVKSTYFDNSIIVGRVTFVKVTETAKGKRISFLLSLPDSEILEGVAWQNTENNVFEDIIKGYNKVVSIKNFSLMNLNPNFRLRKDSINISVILNDSSIIGTQELPAIKFEADNLIKEVIKIFIYFSTIFRLN